MDSSKELNTDGGEKRESLKCPLAGCAHKDYCVVMEILKKAPKPGGKCSYFDSDKSHKRKSTNKDSTNEL